MKPFYVLDIETLANSADCRGQSLIAMPNFAFVYMCDEYIRVLYGRLAVQPQINYGAAIGASTLGFWMQEAVAGNPAAVEIIQAMNAEPDNGYVFEALVVKDEGVSYAEATGNLTNVEVMLQVASFFRANGAAPVIGNGPEFDNTIFEAAFRKIVHDVAQRTDVPFPWPFWGSSSARTYKEIAMERGHYVKSLQETATSAAETIMGVIRNYYDTDDHMMPVPNKHDPLLDALSEAFTVKALKRII